MLKEVEDKKEEILKETEEDNKQQVHEAGRHQCRDGLGRFGSVADRHLTA